VCAALIWQRKSRGALGDDGEAEAGDVDAAGQELGGDGDRFGGVADDDRDDWVDPFTHVHASSTSAAGGSRWCFRAGA